MTRNLWYKTTNDAEEVKRFEPKDDCICKYYDEDYLELLFDDNQIAKVTPVLKCWGLENSYELDNTTMAYLLVQSLYKNKLINEATYEKIMRKYKRRSVVYAKKRYDQSA